MDRPGSFTSLDEWLPWLETLSPREIVLGLERVQAVQEVLALPAPARVITVAGTNGKGSSAAMLEAMFGNAGYRTGCYTSPHVLRYNERIRIDRVAASDEAVMAALERVQAARGDVPLTFFEFGTLAALVAFAAAGVDTLILEVGMGGRLDAVNAVEPDACLITNVALDHMAWLGDDVESIAREKAGIMRPGKPVIFGGAACPQAVLDRAAETGALLSRAGADFRVELPDDDREGWTWHGRHTVLGPLDRLAMTGRVQYANAAAVLAVIESLGLDGLLTPAQVNAGIGKLTVPGRFQVIDQRPRWVLDVAHNPAAAEVLAASLAGIARRGRVTAVIGMLADKDVPGMVGAIAGLVDNWIAVTVAGSRAAGAAALAQEIAAHTGKPCLIEPRIDRALAIAAERAAPEDLVLVTGSFYLVGPALEWLAERA